MRRSLLFLVLLLLIPAIGQAGFWGEVLDKVTGRGGSIDNPTQDEISRGLTEALRLGSERAVALASAPGGYLDNPRIHIPLPDKIRTASDMLRRFGLGKQVDTFELTTNRAAENSAKEALPIFKKAISELTFVDVQKLWQGGDHAITDCFREKTRPELYEKFRPIVHDTVNRVGVTRSYQNLVQSPTARQLILGTDLDLDHYVTDKALAGLFTLLADEETAIRRDPVARTTRLLKKVFGR